MNQKTCSKSPYSLDAVRAFSAVLRVLTSGPVHTLMAKDTEGEQKMDE